MANEKLIIVTVQKVGRTFMFSLFRNLTKRDKFFMSLILIFIIGQVWLELQLPVYMQSITLLIQTPGSELKEILSVGSFMLLAALGSLFLSVIVAILVAETSVIFSALICDFLFNIIIFLFMELLS